MSAKINDGLTKNQRWYRTRGYKLAASRGAARRSAKPEECALACRRYYAINSERQRQRARTYYRTVVKAKMRTDEWRAKERMKKAKRRAMKAGVPATLTWQEWLEICERFSHCCAYCGEALPLEQDHVVPLSKGGWHAKENIVPACKSCNSSKGDRHAPIHVGGA